MPGGRTLAGALGLTGDWDLGENDWKDANDLNLLKLSVMVGKVVASRVSADPGAPAEGECHICEADHATQPNMVSCFDEGAWHYFNAPEGYKLWSIADAKEYQFTAAGGWAEVVAASGGGGSGGGGSWYGGYVPLAADFPTLIHYGASANDVVMADDADIGLTFDSNAYTASENWRCACQATPADTADWKVTARITPVPYLNPHSAFGLWLVESATGKGTLLGQGFISAQNPRIHVRRESGAAFVSDTALFPSFGTPIWLRVRYELATTTYFFEFSYNGKQWNFAASLPKATGYTTRADQIGLGFYVNNGTAGARAYGSCDYFRVT